MHSQATIMVVDDDEQVRRTICENLEDCGFEVIQARDGQEAMTHLEEGRRPNVVITDLMMPDKGGLETIYEMRAVNPAVKIIAMTGGVNGDTSSYLELAEEVGAMYKITKPFTPEQLLTVLAAAKTA